MSHVDTHVRLSHTVGDALDSAARRKLPPTQMIACLADFIDVIVRCKGGDAKESAQVFNTLSGMYERDPQARRERL